MEDHLRMEVAESCFPPEEIDSSIEDWDKGEKGPHVLLDYGIGAIGQKAPRTAHSFPPELEAQIAGINSGARLSVEEFAKELSNFFTVQWNALMAGVHNQPGNDMVFLIGGYNQGAPYGRIFEFYIPNRPTPVERHAGGDFGLIWGGQRQFVDLLLNGYDSRTPELIGRELGLDATGNASVLRKLSELATPIPYQFLPLQDCVDLSIFLVRTTMKMQTWMVDVRGVGGAVDVATITKADGHSAIQAKQVTGEKDPTSVRLQVEEIQLVGKLHLIFGGSELAGGPVKWTLSRRG